MGAAVSEGIDDSCFPVLIDFPGFCNLDSGRRVCGGGAFGLVGVLNELVSLKSLMESASETADDADAAC